jgi:hypothetical protein
MDINLYNMDHKYQGFPLPLSSVNNENLPFVMIWLGSNDSSPSFSPKQAYNVRTLLFEKREQNEHDLFWR